MDVSVDIDVKKLQKGLQLSEKKMAYLHKRAATITARNLRTKISKDSMGLGQLRRKKVIKARVKKVHKGIGVWVGLNDVSASEFRGKKQEGNGGVTFRGMFFEGAFRGRYMRDPKGVSRIFKNVGGYRVEVLIPIEKDAQKYLEEMVQPDIPKLFKKNFEHAVDALPHFWKGS